jgi:hypothetical protein
VKLLAIGVTVMGCATDGSGVGDAVGVGSGVGTGVGVGVTPAGTV